MKKLVIIPGGFHPFHAGHKALYDAARDAFPSADVYVAATADTSTRPFPFEVKQKLARIAGIDGHRFIQVKSPFQAKEITQHYDPNETVLIFARSDKDRETQPQAGAVKKDGTAGYLQPYKRNGLEPMSKHGYMVYLPTVQFGPGMTSATEIRAKWPDMDSEQKTRLVNQLYPDTVQKTRLADVIVQMLDAVMGSQQKTDEGLGNLLSYAIPIAGNVAVGKHIYDILAKAKKPPAASPNSGPQIPPPPDSGSTWIDDTNESTVINDPEAGIQIRPAGGMGTWTEDSLRKNLAEKFGQMLTLLKTGQYDKIHDVLKQGSWVDNMVRALAEYQAFQAQQGRRPMAKGAEIDITDYVDEKRAGQ